MNCNSDEEGDGDCNKGGGQATAMATAMKRMMGNDGGGRQRGQWRWWQEQW